MRSPVASSTAWRAARGLGRALAVLGGLAGAGALATTVAGLAARAVPPSTLWWPQLAALVLPVAAPVAGAVGGGWAVYAFRSRRAWAWAMAVAHLAAAGAPLVRASERTARAGDGPGMRVLTLNAAYSQRGRVDAIAARFSDFNPHVVGVQEVGIRPGKEPGTWSAQGAPLALLQNAEYELAALDGASETGGLLSADGTALFSRLPMSRSALSRLATTGDPQSGRYTRTELTWEGQPVAVYNVHFRSFEAPRPWKGEASWWAAARATREDFVAREAEARVLRRALDAEPLPFVVLGDFNATPDQWSYSHVAAGQIDALGPGYWRATYPDDRPLVRIDAVLASVEWSVRVADILPAGLSDHRAVTAELVLAP